MSAVDHALNTLAYVSLRALSPRRAHSVVAFVGALLPQRTSIESVRDAARGLRRGTCLSRSLAISARAPRSDVVIGVSGPRELDAHAWVEIDRVPLRPTDPRGLEIARLRRA